ncbi:MAG: oligosaccharide flippase family protein [Fibrobacteres bacterium]|jgi:O-antigen/teichoic acid export membrane protein|nr:oligosaccharide flippase family protein [Fibrobacterota bacterium]
MIKSFVKSSALYFAANALSKVMTFSLWIYLARILSMEEMGKWSLLNVTITVISFFMTLELVAGFNRFYLEFTSAEERRRFEVSFVNLLVLINLATGLALWAGKPLLDRLVFPMPPWLFGLLLAMPLTNTLSGAYLCKLRLDNRVFQVLAVTLLQALLYLTVTLIALRAGMEKLQAIFLGLLSQNIVPIVLQLASMRMRAFILDFKLLRPALTFSLYLLPSLFGAYLTMVSGKYLLGKLGDAASLGILEANGKLTMFLAMFMDPMYLATTPVIYRHYKEAGFGKRYAQLMGINGLALLALSLPIAAFSTELVRIIAGEQYAGHAGVVLMLLTVSLFSFLSRYLAINEHLAKKTQYDIIPELGSGILNIGLCFLLIPKYGVWGAAGAMTLAYALRFGIYLVFAERFFPSLFVGYRDSLLFVGGSLLLLGLNHFLSDAGVALKAALCLAEYAILLWIFLKRLGISPASAWELTQASLIGWRARHRNGA